MEQTRRLGRDVVEQALREEKQLVGEHDGACLLCHLDVIMLTRGGKLIAQRVGRRVVRGHRWKVKVMFDC